MPHRDWRFRIQDILDAIAAIRAYTEGMDLEKFAADRKTVDAVLRNLIVIGEAATNLPEAFGESHPNLPWADMRALRNFVVHEYFGVSDAIIWDTVQRNLPALIVPLKEILQTEPEA